MIRRLIAENHRTLATDGSERKAEVPLDVLSVRLGEILKKDAERKRHAALRMRLYRDAAARDMDSFIEHVFDAEELADVRKRFVEWSASNNVIRRIVNTKSTVYTERARRTVASSQEKYDELARRMKLQLTMRWANKMLNLFNDVLLGFRVRNRDGLLPTVDVVTTDLVTPIPHPVDDSYAIGWIIDQSSTSDELVTDLRADVGQPHHRVWTNHETFMTDKAGTVIQSTWEKLQDLGLSRMPFVHVATEPPAARGRIFETSIGKDMVAATMAAWFQQVMLLKESKSATRQTAFSGDISNTPTGQSQDSERDLILGEGVTAQTLDRGTDQTQFRQNSDFVEERAAAGHGIAPSVLRHEGASSGFEVTLRRLPLHELRKEQIEVFREGERELHEVIAEVVALDMPEHAFDASKFSIDFGEIEQPLSRQERVAVFKEERGANLTDTVDEIQRRNPDLDEKSADKEMNRHIDREAKRVIANQAIASLHSSANEDPDDPLSTDEVARIPPKAENDGISGTVQGREASAGAPDA